MKTIPRNALVSLAEAEALIAAGAVLSVAGPESLLDQLPPGRWIGGTTAYFTTEGGGVHTADQLFVTHLPDGEEVRFEVYPPESLIDIMRDAPENGFSFAVVPSGGDALRRFSQESRFWADILLKPVVGWIAGFDLGALGTQTAKVYLGSEGAKYEDAAVVAHVSLPVGHLASIDTINIFERDPRHTIRFSDTGFSATECIVDGAPERLIDLLKRMGNGDGRLPLVGDFGGASINVSIQSIDAATGHVNFYAPVFTDVEYYLARPVGDYAKRFAEEIERYADQPVFFSCNCILNFLYGDLEGKRTGSLQGPVTFGEIAYLLHNQTMVILRID